MVKSRYARPGLFGCCAAMLAAAAVLCCASSQAAKKEKEAAGPQVMIRASVTKGARPDRVRFAPVPRNFKGAVEVPRLKEEYLSAIKAGQDVAHDRKRG